MSEANQSQGQHIIIASLTANSGALIRLAFRDFHPIKPKVQSGTKPKSVKERERQLCNQLVATLQPLQVDEHGSCEKIVF